MILVTLYLAAIVTANLLVAQFGPSITILNAFLFIGLDLTTRDALHERWQSDQLFTRMLAIIGAGSVLSALLNANAGPIALASFAAFALAGLTDTLIYHLLRDETKLVRMNASNVFSAGVDSLVFPLLAFGLPLLWPIVVGQFVAKVAGGLLWSLLLNRERSVRVRPAFD